MLEHMLRTFRAEHQRTYKTAEKIEKIMSYFRNNKNIVHYVRAFGNWDLEAQIETYSEEEFN